MIPVCAVISGGCLISRHSTSKQADAGPIPEMIGPETLLLQQSSARHLVTFLFKMCMKSESMLQRGICCDGVLRRGINAATRYCSEVLISSMSEKKATVSDSTARYIWKLWCLRPGQNPFEFINEREEEISMSSLNKWEEVTVHL
jgi:hypothetical protein